MIDVTRWWRRPRPIPPPAEPPPAAKRPGASPARFDAPALRPKGGEDLPVLLVLLVGLDEARVLPYLDSLAARREAGHMLPVVITDLLDLAPLRSRRLIFEYLPDPERQRRRAPDLDTDLYRLRRLHLWRRKWQPLRVVAFGETAKGLLAAWRASPFEFASRGSDLHPR